VHDHPLGGHADLAGVGKRAEDRGADRRVDIRILQNKQGRLASSSSNTGFKYFAPVWATILPTGLSR